MNNRSSCLICQHPYSKDKFLVDSNFYYLICSNCGFGQLNKVTAGKRVYKKEAYYQKLSKPVSNPVMQWLLTRRLYKTPAEWVNSLFKKGKILDIGCGNGEFLAELQNLGWDVFGTDISKIAAAITQRKIGQEKVKSGDFLKLELKRVDVVSMWHVLEHVDDPIAYSKKILRILNPEGYFIGEVPSFDSQILKLFKNNYSWLMVPEHSLYFTKKSLEILLKKSGFNNIQINYSPRSLLNFALSFNNFLKRRGLDKTMARLLFIISIPLSIMLGVIFVKYNKGEVIRFIAQKKASN